MASWDASRTLSVDLPLQLQTEPQDGSITDAGLRDIVKDLNENIYIFVNHVRQRKDISFVSISNVKFKNGTILLTFDLTDEEQLQSLYECIKTEDNELSRWISKYFYEKSLEFIAGLRLQANITCRIRMPKGVFHKCNMDLCDMVEELGDTQAASDGMNATCSTPESIDQTFQSRDIVQQAVKTINQGTNLPENKLHEVSTSTRSSTLEATNKVNGAELTSANKVQSGSCSLESRKESDVDKDPESVQADTDLYQNTEPGPKMSTADASSHGGYQESTALTKRQPGSYQYNTRANQTGPEIQRVRRSFLLYYPPIKGWKVKEIIIQSDNKYINAEMRMHSTDMYEYSIDIPVDQLDMSYEYVCQLKCDSFLNLKGNIMGTPPEKSVKFHLSNCMIKRDTWKKQSYKIKDPHQFDENSVSIHLADLLYHCSEAFSIDDACSQIEQLCATKLRRQDAMNVLQSLALCLPSGSRQTNMLFVVTIANVLENHEEIIKECIVEKESAQTIIKCLQFYSMNDLPASRRHSVRSVSYCLCKIAFGNTMCYIEYLNACYPFYEDSFLLDRLKSRVYSDTKIVPDKPQMYDCALELCRKLHHNAIQYSSDTAKDSLDTLLRHIPLKMALFVASKICLRLDNMTTRDRDVHDLLDSSIRIRIESSLRDIKKGRNVERLRELWKVIVETDMANERFMPKFEETLIFIIECYAAKKELKTAVADLVSECNFFQEEQQREKVVTVIVNSQNQYVLELFFTLATVSDWESQLILLQPKPFLYFCTTYTKRRTFVCSRDLELQNSLKDIKRLWDLPVVKQKSEFQDVLVKVWREELKRFQLHELVNSLKHVDAISNTNEGLAIVFIEHITYLLNDRHQRPEDVMRTLEQYGSNCVIDTRLAAHLAYTLLDTFGVLSEKSSILDNFRMLVKQSEFWMQVLNSSGPFKYLIESNEMYKMGRHCITDMTNLFQTHEVYFAFVRDLERDKQKLMMTKRLLEFSCDREKIDRYWSDALSKFKEIKQKVLVVRDVLTHIKNKSPKLPDGFDEVTKGLKDFENRLAAGTIKVNECDNTPIVWKGLEGLPHVCEYLKDVVSSSVFWNVSFEHVFQEYMLRIDEAKCEDPLLSLCSLFKEMSVAENTGENLDNFMLFMTILQKMGPCKYEEKWKDLIHKSDFRMEAVLQMFRASIDISTEIKIVKGYLHIDIEKDVEDCLQRIFSIDTVKSTVDAIESVVEVFDLDVTEDQMFTTAIKSFRQLLHGGADEFTFSDVKLALSTVYSLVQNLSEETTSIMIALGTATSLINFLRTIVDEDIKNLIDAVEDISEQQVRESTVSALIEVKQYLHPFLLPNDRTCEELFKALEKQTKLSKTNSKSLPNRIEDCIQNLHNLKSLYNGVANRGEQTKEMIRNINQKGLYLFQLNKTNTCVTFEASYKQNKTRETRKMSTLIDLRSRALLLTNTERKSQNDAKFSRNDLSKFVENIDICLEIADSLFTLFASGHTGYMVIKVMVQPDDLLRKEDELSLILNSWLHDLSKERGRYYLLNFIQGNQIHILYKYLEGNRGETHVQTILQFIHPAMQSSSLYDMYHKEKNQCENWSIREMLHSLGFALHAVVLKLKVPMFERRVQMPDKRALSTIVQPGKLTVAQLDDSSFHTVKTVLALYMNTTHTLPEPNHVIFCTSETKFTELELLIQRCIGAYEFYGKKVLFCIANVEMLPNEIQFSLVETLRNLHNETKFFLAVICRGSRNHPFIDELSDCVTSVNPATDKTVRDLFHEHCGKVMTVTSEYSGLGKSSYIKCMSHKRHKGVITLHVSGSIRKSNLVERVSMLHIKRFHVLHIDLGSVENPSELDTFLFELVVLRYVTAGNASVSLQTHDVYIEVANTINDSLRNSLQTAILFRRIDLEWNGIEDMIISYELNSPVQVVCQYFNMLEKGVLDRTDMSSDPCAQQPLPAARCKILLSKYLGGKLDSSFPVLFTFINVLADQLKKMSESSFFKVSRLIDMVGSKVRLTVKSKLVGAMIDVCSDFATRSVDVCRKVQISTVDSDEHNQSDFASLVTNRVDSMIRWEDSNHLVFVFHNQNIHTISALYRHLSKVPEEIKNLFESQMKTKMQDFGNVDKERLQAMLQKMARVNPLPLDSAYLKELSSEYALTADNLLKMILVMLRIKANIPVVVMGETGCGKTSLIRYLARICEVGFDVMNIHAGVKEEDIARRVSENNETALLNTNEERWLFLDEINTSDSIGLISDIICHHRFLGNELSPNLVIMGACNPYRLRTSKAISIAGLEGKAKSDELSRLVYRVLPLPEMLVDYVWDFGSLNEKDEEIYIDRMIEDIFKGNDKYHTLFTSLLSFSQSFVREKQESSYAVSLRDVQRCQILTTWFLSILPKKPLPRSSISKSCNVEIKSMILSLAHCYQSRFSGKILRKEYRREIGAILKLHGYEFKTEQGKYIQQEEYIQTVIKEEQSDILRRMKLPPGTARNTALRENVFVILVCIFNRIPIFVVGKPGCSKSLAMQMIKSNLRGKDSEDDFFKELPQLYCVSFQGSESSTSDGIIKVFAKAEKYQESNNADEVLSVVILDEIGLAEVSRFNPLKVLHNLLEPDGQSQPNVAVVGISNWALDASKMNRAIHLSRTDMDEDELFDTAISISESFLEEEETRTLFHKSEDEHRYLLLNDIQEDLRGMARAYVQYIDHLRFKNFHGLRDYYSLIKFVARKYAEVGFGCDKETRAKIISEGITRNFGGLPEETQTLYDVFRRHIPLIACEYKSLMTLVAENITDQIARHLMLISTGESVLGIVDQKLRDIGCNRKEVIFGSQFGEDLTEDYNYRILSRIILCMEGGMVLILKDLESVYGSLYDMLNQNYTIIGKKKNCRIALGPYSNPICHVSDSFRCIVLMDERKLDMTDPPFLNRFEKQYLRFVDIIADEHLPDIERLDNLIDDLSDTKNGRIQKEEMFPIYNEDLTASLVLKAESERDSEQVQSFDGDESVLTNCKDKLLLIIKPEVVVRQNMSKTIPRHHDDGDVTSRYFALPIHSGLEVFLCNEIDSTLPEQSSKSLMFVIFTNSNVHTKIQMTSGRLQKQVEKLGAFKSEKQLSSRIQHFWESDENNILLVQCNAKDDEKHILLTKQIIERYRDEYTVQESNIPKHVCLVIHLDRSKTTSHGVSQLNFLTDWKLVMMDSLDFPPIPLPILCKMTLQEAILAKRPLTTYIQDELFWAYSRIRYGHFGRDVTSIEFAISRIEESSELLDLLEKEILCFIEKQWSSSYDKYWQLHVARDITALSSSASFIDALNNFILSKIKTPLAKLVYKIEEKGVLESFFPKNISTSDHEVLENKRKIWVSAMRNEYVFSVNEIPDETGPECYTCETVDYELRMPFSKYVYDSIEATKDDFMETVRNYRVQLFLSEDDHLPTEVYDEILLQQEKFLIKKIPDLTEFTYQTWDGDYFHDFCTISTQSVFTDAVKTDRTEMTKVVFDSLGIPQCDDPFVFVIRLHTSFWVNHETIKAQIVLIDRCISISPESKSSIIRVLSSTPDTQDITSDFNFNERAHADSYGYEPIDAKDPEIISQTESDTNSQDGELTNDNQIQTIDEKCHVKPLEAVDEADSTVSGTSCADRAAPDLSSADTDGENKLSEVSVIGGTDLLTNAESANVCEDSLLHDDETHDLPQQTITCKTAPDRKGLSNASENETSELFESASDIGNKKNGKAVSGYVSSEDQTQDINNFLEETGENIADETSSVCSRLVNVVCHAILPTTQCLTQHGGADHWLDEVDRTVSLAAQVSRSPDILYSLRVCIELTSKLIVPFQLDQRYLEKLGNAIETGSTLDTVEIFNSIEEILQAVLSSHMSMPGTADAQMLCQRVLTSYFLRCLTSDPETRAFKFVFNLVFQSKIPEHCITLYKVPLSIFLQTVDHELFIDLLSTDVLGVFGLNQRCSDKGDADSSDEENGMQLLQDLDHLLKDVIDAGRFQEPFLVLLTDNLKAVYSEHFFSSTLGHGSEQNSEKVDVHIDKEVEDLFYTCHKTIKRYKPGLKYIASIAFCNAFIHQATGILKVEDGEAFSRVMAVLDVVFSDLPGEETHSLIIVFLKHLSTSMTLVQLHKFLRRNEDKCKFIKDLELKNKVFKALFEKNPLCLHVDKSVRHTICFPITSTEIREFKEKMESMVRQSTSGRNEMMQFLAFVLRDFYLQLTESDLDDTRRTQASIILNEITGSYTSDEILIFTKCILGEQNFLTKMFLLTDASSMAQICKASMLTSFYALLLTYHEFRTEKAFISFFAKCIFCPESIKSCFAPGFSSFEIEQEKSKTEANREIVVHVGHCKCGYKMCFENSHIHNCPFCGKDVVLTDVPAKHTLAPVIAQGKEIRVESVQIPKHLNPATGHILQFLIKGCLLGSMSLGFTDDNSLEKLLLIRDTDAESCILEHIDIHWKTLKELLNVGDNDLTAFIHVVLLEAGETLFASSFETKEESLEWEEAFDKIVCTMCESRFQHIMNLHRYLDQVHEHAPSIENRLLEIDSFHGTSIEHQLITLPKEYRMTTKANKTNFCLELHTRRGEFPLLSEVLDHEADLQLPHHILNLILWHSATVANASYMLKRHDTTVMTAQDFIYFKQNTLKKDIMKSRFESFRSSWDTLRYKLRNYDIVDKMQRIHSESKLAECLILNEDSVPFKVLHTLLDIQNRFLERVLLVAHKCDSLKFMKRDKTFVFPCVNITSLKKGHLIHFAVDWKSLLEQESHSDLVYGCGKQIRYDFHSIEEAVAYEVISGKAFLAFDTISEIVFIDELHKNYAFLIKDIRQSTAQTTLPAEIRNGIRSRKEEDPRMSTELLTHLGIVMTILKKTGGDPELSLVDFLDEWKSVLCRHFPKRLLPSPENCVKLGHVVALSDLLEELNADSVKEGLEDTYRDKLDGPMNDQLMMHLKDDLLSSALFKAIKMFTHRCLASRIADPKQSLRLYLSDESFWPIGSLQHGMIYIGGSSIHLSDLLPDGLMVRHVCDCYDLIEAELESRRQRNLKMTGYATSFQARAKVTPASKQAQKKKRMTGIRKF